jgi:hypothetical protein
MEDRDARIVAQLGQPPTDVSVDIDVMSASRHTALRLVPYFIKPILVYRNGFKPFASY